MTMTLLRAGVFSLLCCLAGTALADKEGHKDVAFDPAAFGEQKAQLERALNSKTYYEISDKNKEEVLKALGRMERHLEGISAISELRPDARVAVFNDQELINNLLTEAAEDSRLVCKREKKLGSNMPVNTCMTVAQRREAQEQARETMRAANRRALTQPGGGT